MRQEHHQIISLIQSENSGKTIQNSDFESITVHLYSGSDLIHLIIKPEKNRLGSEQNTP